MRAFGACLLVSVMLIPSAAYAQATIAGVVRDTSGARAARRDRRGGQRSVDRKGAGRCD